MTARKGRPLTVIRAGDEPPPKDPRVLPLDEAIEDGDVLEVLMALRAEVVRTVRSEAHGQARATMLRQVEQLSLEIEGIRREREKAEQEQAEKQAEVEPPADDPYDGP